MPVICGDERKCSKICIGDVASLDDCKYAMQYIKLCGLAEYVVI